MKAGHNGTVTYWMNLDKEAAAPMNDLIGSTIHLEWTGTINCISCGRTINKTFGQGFCYPCFRDAPEAAPCIMRPELCEAHLGKGRDIAWEEEHHNQPHVVYLAQTSDVKVGVTRTTQIPTRWIDQGAWRALPIAITPYRQLAGLIEVELRQYISDRTDWRKMLLGLQDDTDLVALRDQLLDFLPASLAPFADRQGEVLTFEYPVLKYPSMLTALDFEKERSIRRTLTGIRGQYLMFDGQYVINMRKFSGYQVALNCR